MDQETLTFLLSSQEKRTLGILAKHDGCSMAALLRRLIRQHARRYGLLPPIGSDTDWDRTGEDGSR